MTSYAEYVEQIAKLQSLAETARKDEINGAIQKIKELMQKPRAQLPRNLRTLKRVKRGLAVAVRRAGLPVRTKSNSASRTNSIARREYLLFAQSVIPR
jgi:hypothetical protein